MNLRIVLPSFPPRLYVRRDLRESARDRIYAERPCRSGASSSTSTACWSTPRRRRAPRGRRSTASTGSSCRSTAGRRWSGPSAAGTRGGSWRSSRAARPGGAPRAAARARALARGRRGAPAGRARVPRGGRAARPRDGDRLERRAVVDRPASRAPRAGGALRRDRDRRRRRASGRSPGRRSTSRRCRGSGSPPSEAVAFEDSANGVRAAKAAGLFCVAVPNGVTATMALDEADVLVPSLAALPFESLLERFA